MKPSLLPHTFTPRHRMGLGSILIIGVLLVVGIGYWAFIAHPSDARLLSTNVTGIGASESCLHYLSATHTFALSAGYLSTYLTFTSACSTVGEGQVAMNLQINCSGGSTAQTTSNLVPYQIEPGQRITFSLIFIGSCALGTQAPVPFNFSGKLQDKTAGVEIFQENTPIFSGTNLIVLGPGVHVHAFLSRA